MSCYLDHKDSIDNIKSDLKKAGFDYENIRIKPFKGRNSSIKHNESIKKMKIIAEEVISKWNKSLEYLNINPSIAATITIRPYYGDTDVKIDVIRDEFIIEYNTEVLNNLDNFRKELGIYDSKLSTISYLKELYKEQDEELEKIANQQVQNDINNRQEEGNWQEVDGEISPIKREFISPKGKPTIEPTC